MFFPTDHNWPRTIFSEDRVYRYLLVRQWDAAHDWMIYIGHTPSTAGEINNDATVKRLIYFSQREGAGGFVLANLHALITTDPARILRHNDPIGPDNTDHLQSMLLFAKSAKRLVCCWGSMQVVNHMDSWFLQQAALRGVMLWCFLKNADGAPAHPLYQPNNRQFREFS